MSIAVIVVMVTLSIERLPKPRPRSYALERLAYPGSVVPSSPTGRL